METTNNTDRLEVPPGRVHASKELAVIAWSWPVAQPAVAAYDAVLNASDQVIAVYRSIVQGAWSWWPVVKALGEHMDRGRWIEVEQIELYCARHEMKIFGTQTSDPDRQAGEVRDRDVARVEQYARHRKEHGPGGIITPGNPQWDRMADVTDPGQRTRQTNLPPPPGERHHLK